jgi:hypothetical protein
MLRNRCLFGVEPPTPRIEAVRIVDMSSSDAWAEFSAILPTLSRARKSQGRTEELGAGGRAKCGFVLLIYNHTLLSSRQSTARAVLQVFRNVLQKRILNNKVAKNRS